MSINDTGIQKAVESDKINKSCDRCNRCLDFDEDCKLVPDKVHCFLYGTWGDDNKPLPQGYCPFIHTEN